MLEGEWPRVVLPIASSLELDTADIRCIGEQLYDFIEARLGESTAGSAWDEHLLRSWLPLEAWVSEFIDNTPYRAMAGYHQLAGDAHAFAALMGGK